MNHGADIFTSVTGKSTIVPFQTWCTGEELLDIFTQVLQAEIETLKTSYSCLESLEENDTKMFALIDVMYAGPGNFKIGTIDEHLERGLTKEDFLSNCTSENDFYVQNPNAFTRRRLMDWYMYSEGKFGHQIYDTDNITDVEKRWEFKSETPFQDLMVDKEGAELVDM